MSSETGYFLRVNGKWRQLFNKQDINAQPGLTQAFMKESFPMFWSPCYLTCVVYTKTSHALCSLVNIHHYSTQLQ